MLTREQQKAVEAALPRGKRVARLETEDIALAAHIASEQWAAVIKTERCHCGIAGLTVQSVSFRGVVNLPDGLPPDTRPLVTEAETIVEAVLVCVRCGPQRYKGTLYGVLP